MIGDNVAEDETRRKGLDNGTRSDVCVDAPGRAMPADSFCSVMIVSIALGELA